MRGKRADFLHHGLTVYDHRRWCCLLLSCQSGVSMAKSGQRKNKPTAAAHEWVESSWTGLGMTASGPHSSEILEILWLRHAHGSEGIFCTMGIRPRAPQSDPRRHAAEDSAAPFSFGQALQFIHVGHQCSKGKSLARGLKAYMEGDEKAELSYDSLAGITTKPRQTDRHPSPGCLSLSEVSEKN